MMKGTTKMDKDIVDAAKSWPDVVTGRMVGTGIKLKVTDNDGKLVNYGVQLNNTTLEIEALPNLKVEVIEEH